MGCTSSYPWTWPITDFGTIRNRGVTTATGRAQTGWFLQAVYTMVRCRLDSPPLFPRTTACWLHSPSGQSWWGQGGGHPACIDDGGGRISRVVCMIPGAMGCQDQLLPSASKCLTTQSCVHSPQLTPAGPSSHFRVSLGLYVTPAEPCFLLCLGQHRYHPAVWVQRVG